MNQTKTDKIIRQYDTIVIRKPEIFVRCGYPMDLNEETERIKEEHREAILAILKEEVVGVHIDSKIISSFHKICREIDYAKCKAKRFGWSERTIYTKAMPELQDAQARVLEIKVCKTGIYCAASSWCCYDFYAETEYELAELYNQKTHKLLRIYCQSDKKFLKPPSDLWIEAVNVEKCL